jgi:hypothetical protein
VVERQLSVLAKSEAKDITLRNAVLASAFTGQLVPQNPKDEPASTPLECIRAKLVES